MKKAAFVMLVLAFLFGLCYRIVFAQSDDTVFITGQVTSGNHITVDAIPDDTNLFLSESRGCWLTSKTVMICNSVFDRSNTVERSDFVFLGGQTTPEPTLSVLGGVDPSGDAEALQVDVNGYIKAPPCSFQPGEAKVLVEMLALLDEDTGKYTTGLLVSTAGGSWTYYRSGAPANGQVDEWTAIESAPLTIPDKRAQAVEYRRRADELERAFTAEQDAKAREQAKQVQREATRTQFALVAARLRKECR